MGGFGNIARALLLPLGMATFDFVMDKPAEQRLTDYFDTLGEVLELPSRRASFAIYAMGILGDGERKSVEPIAARACPDLKGVDALHQRLLHFVVNSRWDDHSLRKAAASYALKAMTAREPITALRHPLR